MERLSARDNGVLRVGILGGSFDPPHIGHLILAEEARDQLGLDKVLFAPAGQQPLKQGQKVTAAEDRVRMTELAIADNGSFEVSRGDVDRPGPHYTVDLIAIIAAQLPRDAEIFFLMGFDSLRDLPKWRDPDKLIRIARLVALTRPDVPIDWNALEAALPGVRERVRLLDMPELEIASRDLRERVRTGRSIRYMVTDAVGAYIEEQGLYRE
ncbi:MAG: nicotinate-nucleotide adenylyltransferase [Anaerolineae bacterium]|nr:nicotinate-nucleotide adenylyltransferase [Anaerolineae bacterium]